MEKQRLPRLAYNWISAAGAIIASVTAILTIFLFGLNILAHITNPYIGIFMYMILPPFFILGLLLIPLGMWRYWIHLKRGEVMPPLKWPAIDLNKKPQRNAFIVFAVGTIIFVVGGAVISYQAYHFSESVRFCGTTCHTIMHPEYTAYQNSPHARVACTECHVGSGAGWYTKSKLSGLYQVYAAIAKVYPRPIPTPVRNLRPAQETCEQCHWPRQFYGAQQRQFNHYRYDDSTSYWPISMLVKTGGADSQAGKATGIHWHMNIDFKVEYIARDERRQDIPWVRITNRESGETKVFQDQTNPLKPEEVQAATPRVMDCIDCHNRPSHIYNPPDRIVDAAIYRGTIDRNIPSIKKVAVEAMAQVYSTEDSAAAGIRDYISEYYKSNYAEIFTRRQSAIDSAIVAVTRLFLQNMFPEMKVRWSEYPNNIGHFTNVGCMRCHLGNHKSEDGQVVTHDCNACHTILAQQDIRQIQYSGYGTGQEFKHPEDIGDTWKETGCYECHTGVQP